ncbi:hypothetical protein D3C84_1020950 [compost metagenome]
MVPFQSFTGVKVNLLPAITAAPLAAFGGVTMLQAWLSPSNCRSTSTTARVRVPTVSSSRARVALLTAGASFTGVTVTVTVAVFELAVPSLAR